MQDCSGENEDTRRGDLSLFSANVAGYSLHFLTSDLEKALLCFAVKANESATG